MKDSDRRGTLTPRGGTVSPDKRRPSNKGKRFPAEVLTSKEVAALMQACSRRAPTGVRNRGLIATLYRAGLRCQEALDLRLRDIDRDKGTIRILDGKGHRARTVGIDPSAVAVIERWVDVRRGLGLNGGPLFSTLAGKPMKSSYVRALLPRLGKKAGVDRRVHAHGLRHAFSCELASEGIPVAFIQRALGHRNLATTSRYIEALNPAAVIDAVRSRKW